MLLKEKLFYETCYLPELNQLFNIAACKASGSFTG